ncbi:MAG: SLOG family protein [bacterium]|nr:SLOG family protein [bacterium]
MMTPDRSTTICFTGHRPAKLGGYDGGSPVARSVREWLDRAIARLYARGYRTFISGAALGVGTWAAEAVLRFKPQGPGTRLIMAVPFLDQPRRWPAPALVRWERLCRAADEVVFVTKGWPPIGPDEKHWVVEALNRRNRWMVDCSGMVVAVWDGTPGGTANAVGYARETGVSVCQFNPRLMRAAMLSAATRVGGCR